MRVLLVSIYFVEYALELANALGENNDVHLLLSEQRVAKTVGKDLDEMISSNVSYTLLPYYSLKHPSIIKVLISIFYVYIRTMPDVIHVQECANPLHGIFYLLGPKRIITTVHDVVMHPSGKEISSVITLGNLADSATCENDVYGNSYCPRNRI